MRCILEVTWWPFSADPGCEKGGAQVAQGWVLGHI